MARPDVLFTSKDNGGDGATTRRRQADRPARTGPLMLDLIVLAFWTDTTRNVTFMFANDVSTRNFSFLDGVKENHHSSSHHAEQGGEDRRVQEDHPLARRAVRLPAHPTQGRSRKGSGRCSTTR